ncbi:hypothetical protein Gotur_016210 [Gossypium turneri]
MLKYDTIDSSSSSNFDNLDLKVTSYNFDEEKTSTNERKYSKTYGYWTNKSLWKKENRIRSLKR